MQKYLEAVDDDLVFRPCGPWTEIKLDYLTRYIDIFETSMRKRWSKRNYIDLLAGPGKNRVRESKKVLLGSPLIALTTRYPFTGYFFVDLEDRNTSALDRRCKASPLYEQILIRSGDCNAEVEHVVSRLRRDERNSLNLAFLDPQGMELQWRTVSRLASIRRMDLIIYYPQNGLSRNMHKMYNTEKETAIDRFFGAREWREIFIHWQNKPGLHRQLIDFYKSRLQDLGYPVVFRGDEDLGDEPLIRSQLRNAPLYRLIFASKHERGHEFWTKVLQRDVYGQRRLF